MANAAPGAADDAFTMDEDLPLNAAVPGVLANDTDANSDALTAALNTGPTNTQSFTLNLDGSFNYTPNADFTGDDTFTYHANDGSADSNVATVTITVNSRLLLDTCRFSKTVRVPDPSPLVSGMDRIVQSAVDERSTYANRDTDNLAPGSRRSTEWSQPHRARLRTLRFVGHVGMSSPALDLYQRHRLSVHDFHRMGEAGILPVEGRLELIEGEIIAMAPIGSRHAAIVTRANMLFVQAVAGRAIVSVQNPIILGEHSEPEPDLALIRPRDDFYALALPRADEVLLIVEVADTTLRYDREIKIPLYARHGIPEVWLIDVDGRTLTIFETPAEGRYRDERRAEPVHTLAPKELPGVEVDLSRLFGTT